MAEETFEEQEVEVNEIFEAFQEGVNAEDDEDSIKMAMIGAGATFKNVTRLYNQYMIDEGLAMSKEEKDKVVNDTLEGRDFDTEETFEEAVLALIEEMKGATERSAAATVRAYAKKNELECWSKPKSTGNRSGFASKYYEYLIANPGCTKEEATKYIEDPANSDNVRKHLSHYIAIWQLVNTIHNS